MASLGELVKDTMAQPTVADTDEGAMTQSGGDRSIDLADGLRESAMGENLFGVFFGEPTKTTVNTVLEGKPIGKATLQALEKQGQMYSDGMKNLAKASNIAVKMGKADTDYQLAVHKMLHKFADFTGQQLQSGQELRSRLIEDEANYQGLEMLTEAARSLGNSIVGAYQNDVQAAQVIHAEIQQLYAL